MDGVPGRILKHFAAVISRVQFRRQSHSWISTHFVLKTFLPLCGRYFQLHFCQKSLIFFNKKNKSKLFLGTQLVCSKGSKWQCVSIDSGSEQPTRHQPNQWRFLIFPLKDHFRCIHMHSKTRNTMEWLDPTLLITLQVKSKYTNVVLPV